MAISLSAHSQPLVHEEPHHIPIFENKAVRVLNVWANPADTTQFHKHINDIAYFVLSGSTLFLEELSENSREVELKTGWVGSNITHRKDPLIHRFANIGDRAFRLLGVELLTDKYLEKSFTSFEKVLHENDRFSVQEVKNGEFVSSVPMVVFFINSERTLNRLDYIKPGKNLSISQGEERYQIVIIQLK